MSIKVESNSVPEAAPAIEPVKQEAQSDDKSAPEVKAPEQNESSESDTEEKEADKEEKDDARETEDDSESNESDKEKPKKKGGFQRRIDKLNARNTAAQQEIEYWKQQALKGAGEPKKEPVDSKPEVAEGKPNPDKYDTHAEWAEALADWKVEQKLKERDQQLEKSKLKTEQETVLKAHTDRVKSFVAKTTDFEDVLTEVDHIPVSPTVQQIIVTSENGPELMYELAKNPKEYERICSLPPLAAARELGKIESKLSSQSKDTKKPETKKTTKAPEPISPVGSKGGVVEKSIDDPNLTQAEYEKLRAKQMKGQ